VAVKAVKLVMPEGALLEARYHFRVFAVTLFRLELELQHSLPIPAKK